MPLSFTGRTLCEFAITSRHDPQQPNEGVPHYVDVAESGGRVLLDIGMPVLDGFAVVRTLWENPRSASLPVVAVTTYAMQGDRDKS